MIGLVHRGAKLNDPAQHAVNILKAHGYQTALAGVQHEVHGDPRSLGYEQILSPTRHDAFGADVGQAEAACDFLAARDRTRPFFLSVGFFATHRTPRSSDPRGEQWHNRDASPLGDPRAHQPPPPLPDHPQIRADFADFAESVRRLDGYLGIVLDGLDRQGLARDTLVICTTDHGIAFPKMKCNLTDAGLGVLLLLRGPGVPRGRAVSHMVSHLDVMPTVYDLIGLRRPLGLRGGSMVRTWGEPSEPIRDTLFATVNYHAAYEPMRAVRTETHKYIRRWNILPHPVLPNCDDSPSKTVMTRDFGWAGEPMVEEQLFDLRSDPAERHNLATDPAHASTLTDLRRRLDEWMRDTSDPLRAGQVPAPPGFKVNLVNGYSPSEEPKAV